MKVHDGIARAGQHRPRDPGLRARDLRLRALKPTDAVEGAFDGVADRVDGIPLVGDNLATALRDAPRGATNTLRATGDSEQGDRLDRGRRGAGAPDLPARQPASAG